MEKLYNTYPDDKEVSIFYALALDASAEPTDNVSAAARELLGDMLLQAQQNENALIAYETVLKNAQIVLIVCMELA